MKYQNKILGSKIVVCARAGGANTTPFFLAAHFAKQNTKFGGGESEGEAGIHFPHAPFSARLARASGFAARSAASFGILFKMSSDFFQQTPPKLISCLVRRFAPRFGGHFREEMPGIFEINRQFSRRKAAVHKLLSLYCGFAAMSRWFSSAFGEKQNEILQIVGVKRCLFQN